MNDVTLKTESRHFTKAGADRACTEFMLDQSRKGQSSGHARVRCKVICVNKLTPRRWKVVSY